MKIKYFDWDDEFKIWLRIKYPDITWANALDPTIGTYKVNEFLEWYLNKIESEGYEIISVNPVFGRKK